MITYTPTANFNGSDSFTYTVSSGGVTESGTISVNVAAVNDAPVSIGTSVSTAEDTALSGNAASTDVDGGAATYALVSGPAHGSITFAVSSGRFQ